LASSERKNRLFVTRAFFGALAYPPDETTTIDQAEFVFFGYPQYVDVLQLTEDGQRLEWLEGANILPEGEDCALFWADGKSSFRVSESASAHLTEFSFFAFPEVRLSPSADTLFGSTRGLEAKTKGYVASWPLLPSGRLALPEKDASHRLQTRTSGGWANAIAVCPTVGLDGAVFLTLTDSEEGFVQILGFGKEGGFNVLDEIKLASKDEHVGASVAVWL